jgi:hypothetical protein
MTQATQYVFWRMGELAVLVSGVDFGQAKICSQILG